MYNDYLHCYTSFNKMEWKAIVVEGSRSDGYCFENGNMQPLRLKPARPRDFREFNLYE